MSETEFKHAYDNAKNLKSQPSTDDQLEVHTYPHTTPIYNNQELTQPFTSVIRSRQDRHGCGQGRQEEARHVRHCRQEEMGGVDEED